MTRRLSLRLAPVLEFLEGDAEASKKAKKSKNLPRGDYSTGEFHGGLFHGGIIRSIDFGRFHCCFTYNSDG